MANEEMEPPAAPPNPDRTPENISSTGPPSAVSPLASGAPLVDPVFPIEEPVSGRPAVKLTSLQITLILLLALFTIFITWRTKSMEKSVLERTPASAMLAKDAPDFSLPSLSDETISLADYRGKKNVVVSYWASWCGPCKVELPELRDFYKRHHKNDSDFEILAITIDEEKSEAEKYVVMEKLPFPVLLDPHSKVADTYAVEAIPATFVVDKSGKIVYAHTGLDQMMQFQLARTLGVKIRGTDDEEGPEKNP
jgi:peroxiredoxin